MVMKMRYYVVIEYNEETGEVEERNVVIKPDDFDMEKDYHYLSYYHDVIEVTEEVEKNGEFCFVW